MQIDELIDEYILDCKIKNLTISTITQKEIQLKSLSKFLKSECDIYEIKDVTKQNINKWIVSKLERKNKARTINTQIKIHKVFFEYCVNENYIKRNPFEKIKLLKQEKPKFLIFNDKEIKRMIDYYSFKSYIQARNKVIISLIVETGMRVSEVINLNIDDVQDESVRVFGKGRKWRVIPISAQMRKMMMKYERLRLKNLSQANVKCDSYFITTNKNKYSNPIPIQKMIRDTANAVKVRRNVRASPHSLRHYHALKSLELGTPIQQLSKNLGHSSIKTTEIYLSQITNEQLEKQALENSKSPLSAL